MIEVLTDLTGKSLEQGEVDDPGLAVAEGASHVNEDIVVMAVDRLELVAEDGEMSGGEPETLPLHSDAMRKAGRGH